MTGISVTANFGPTGNLKIARPADVQSGANTAYGDGSAVTADITAALANETISGNSPALALVTQIQTDFETLMASLAVASSTSDVLVSYSTADVVSKNNLRTALAKIMQAVDGASDLS
jgi:hypothetical protein